MLPDIMLPLFSPTLSTLNMTSPVPVKCTLLLKVTFAEVSNVVPDASVTEFVPKAAS